MFLSVSLCFSLKDIVKSFVDWFSNFSSKNVTKKKKIFRFEPNHEIMALIALCKLNLQTRMRSNSLALYTRLIFGQTLRLLPYLMCAHSEGSGIRAVSPEPLLFAYAISTIIYVLAHFILLSRFMLFFFFTFCKEVYGCVLAD